MKISSKETILLTFSGCVVYGMLQMLLSFLGKNPFTSQEWGIALLVFYFANYFIFSKFQNNGFKFTFRDFLIIVLINLALYLSVILGSYVIYLVLRGVTSTYYQNNLFDIFVVNFIIVITAVFISVMQLALGRFEQNKTWLNDPKRPWLLVVVITLSLLIRSLIFK